MKKRNTKQDFTKFTKRNKHKRKSKDRQREEIAKSLDAIGVPYEGFVLRDVSDKGRRGRSSEKKRRDEIRVRGIFLGSRSGFGFVTPEEGYDRDIFIPEQNVNGAIDSDFVEIIYHKYYNRSGEEKTEGRVLKILEEGRSTLIGTVTFNPPTRRGNRKIPSFFSITPDDNKINLAPNVRDLRGAVEGDKVVVKIQRGTGTSYSPNAEIISVLGDAMSKEANYSAILYENGIETEFTSEELTLAEEVAKRPVTLDGRISHLNDIILTIDSESAKDLDDAVSLKKTKSGWLLGVHIADVSYYVDEKSALERCAMNRGNSVYFTDKVVPMLPKALSNGACSLNAGEEKYAISAMISLSHDGEIKGLKLEPSVIKSRVRGVYSEVNRLYSGDTDGDLKKKYKEVLPTLMKMRELYFILKKRSEERGALDMDISEGIVILNEKGEPCDIVKLERGDGEKMIEQFMLCANEAVATYLSESQIPCVYRVHENPPEEKFREFVTFAHNLGFDTSSITIDSKDAKSLGKLLKEAEERGVLQPVSYTLLRSMAKAKYSEAKAPHFGLGIENYCHFTSPIRRLSDLATHRIIHKVVFENKKPIYFASYAKRAARAATEAELRTVTAERRIEDLYKVIYMSDKIGEIFPAIVSSVTSFGMFCELENTCEGLVPMSELPGMFIFDEKNLTLRCGSLVYHLGDKVNVKLEEADIVKGKLRFSLVL